MDLRKAVELLVILISSPQVTLRLLTWTRVKNAFHALSLSQGNLGLLLQRYSAIYNVSRTEIDFSSTQTPEACLGDVVLFPAIDWGFRFQRPQHLARELGARGFRVFYISTVPLIARDGPNFLVQGTPAPGVVLVQLASGNFRIPDFYRDELTNEEVTHLLQSYHQLCSGFSIVTPTLIIQHPFWWPLVSRLFDNRVVYDCLDWHAGFHDKPNTTLLGYERHLIDRADAVVVTSDELRRAAQRESGCYVIRNACEFKFFCQAARKKERIQPVISYIGAVSDWFDGQLLFELARARQDWLFEIYGAINGADVGKARSLQNVMFIGEIPYESVPSAIARSDVCIIPFKLNALTKATNPVKVYEYLAVGRPVVATMLPELAEMESVDVFRANDATSFISKVEHAIEVTDMPDRVQARKDWAERNDWAGRADEFMQLIAKLGP